MLLFKVQGFLERPMEDVHTYLQWDVSYGDSSARKLVVVLHGLDATPTALDGVCNIILEESDKPVFVLAPKLPLRWARCVDLMDVAEEIVGYVDDKVPMHSIENVDIVGHSAGGVIAQIVYLLARKSKLRLGQLKPKDFRLILIAPINRGWEVSHHLPLARKIATIFGLCVIPLVVAWERAKAIVQRRKHRQPWVLQIRRGSPLLFWLRMSWLEQNCERPKVIQLLGSIDEIVSWRDMVDPVSGEHFVHAEVPFSDHVSILNFEDSKFGEIRKQTIKKALICTPDEIKNDPIFVEPWDVEPSPPEMNVKRVVFVLHGIRDEGHWTQNCLLYTSPSPRDRQKSRMPSSA